MIREPVEPGYEPLADILDAALDQAQRGKGKERHANDRQFIQQPIMEIGRMVGPGFAIGQAIKKGQEATRLSSGSAQVRELLGAINYLAAAVLLIEEEVKKRNHANRNNGVAPAAYGAIYTEVNL